MQELSPLQIEVARKLTALISGGRWQVGERLSDARLAQELKVSRSPIRQALNLLTRQGLVAYTPGKGYRLEREPGSDESLDELMPHSESESLYGDLMSARAVGRLGAEVSEAQLVEQFQVTRGAVRRALMRFATEGLAERLPGHGWHFAESLDNEQAVNESYEFRLIVECNALMTPGYAPRPDQLAALQREQTEILQMPIGQLQRDAWFNANAAFHETLAAWSNNRFLTEAVRRQNSLRRMTEYANFGHLAEVHIHQACTDHLGILAALAEGDRDYATALLRRHITRSADI
ncbi:GntR family transcriptional regulator [Achromobacter marplatensis]|uniref:GntR family transcriptional regulator n=1 Tax=Achromobacter marplatensis TaxID=470868 RepID=UPI0039F736FC